MKLFIAIAFLTLIISPSYSQGHYSYCVKVKSLKRSDLDSISPFNKTTHIELVSFNPYPSVSIPMKNGKINTRKFMERKVIKSIQEDQLIDVLYNHSFDPKVSRDSITLEVSSCYEPKNAILFKDKKDEIIAFLEVCFECHKYKTTGIQVENFCYEKFDMLKDYFGKCGIKIGVTEFPEMIMPVEKEKGD